MPTEDALTIKDVASAPVDAAGKEKNSSADPDGSKPLSLSSEDPSAEVAATPAAAPAVPAKKKVARSRKKALPSVAKGTAVAEIPTQKIVFVGMPPIFKRRKRRLLLKIFLLLLPALLGFIYYQFIASPMYVSHASFAIRNAENSSTSIDIASIFRTGNSSSGNDAFIVNDYIQSLDLAQDVNKELNIVDHYSDRGLDIISRLWHTPTQDELLKYWKWAVIPSLSYDTGIISLEVRAYSPQMAQNVNRAVLSRSEALVNEMSARAQSDAVSLAQQEVKRAEDRVRKAQGAMREFRDKHKLIDPRTTAAGVQSLVSSLEAEATGLRTKITEASSFMQQDAPALKTLRQRLAAVEKQLAEEKLRVAGQTTNQANLNALVGAYEDLAIEADFAQRQLVSAMASLEQARVQQTSQSRYVVAYQQPTLPDESLYPRPYLFTLLIFLGTLIVVGLLSLMIAAIRDHAGF